MRVLHIRSSARSEGSISRQIGNYLVAALGATVQLRDLAEQPLLAISAEDLIDLHASNRQPRASLQAQFAQSQQLIDELNSADTVIIEAPMYNFGPPAVLKQWVDAICRAGETFRYSESGPVGLVSCRRAVVVTSSGGAPLGGEGDFVGPYLERICRFIGIDEVYHLRASGSKGAPEQLLATATEQVDALLADWAV
ncbi:ACP phosphodiesterase [Gammaproteobacteria bacterium LSUCC0057]|uniref:FMN dependent NADH:quinone oxidoreductase n=1 Tax=Gammaproteobacteria bacterium LSUCC0057 TaxID=2559237 RepID=A0A4Y8UN62_9GAMM|nr:ACP phosphodiesterase [Gammaproteobacteria bacterium LSUCC0057]